MHAQHETAASHHDSAPATGPTGWRLQPSTLVELERMYEALPRAAGQKIFVEGEAARGVFLLCEGRARLTRRGTRGKPLTAREAGAGELLGLPAAIAGKAHDETATAINDCRLLFIPCEKLLDFLSRHPDACLAANRALSAALQNLYAQARTIKRRSRRRSAQMLDVGC